MTLKRWKLTIEYKGTEYAGFQIQENVPSIQGALQCALKDFCQRDIKVVCAGRTDAGVHAQGQVAHLDLDYGERPLSAFDLAKAINAHMMEEPISVIHAEEVSQDFHARFGAKTKCYEYRILNRPFKPGLQGDFVWWIKKPLNVTAMEQAAQHLIGKHDFTSFRDSACQAKSPVRTVDSITLETAPLLNGQDIVISVTGQSFLHHMVRNIVGTLTLVGEGKWHPDDVKIALEAKDRAKGGVTAPPQGLTLVNIDYN